VTTLAVERGESVPGGTATLTARGELDMDTAEQLEQAVSALIQDTPTVLAIDFSGVTFCDSSGIGALIRAHKLAASRGCRLELRRVDPEVRRVFDLVGLSERLIAAE
jgi:anti-sigma B factor antagonist